MILEKEEGSEQIPGGILSERSRGRCVFLDGDEILCQSGRK